MLVSLDVVFVFTKSLKFDFEETVQTKFLQQRCFLPFYQ